MRFEQQLRMFKTILDEYPQNTPLHKFLPAYYRKNKQMGSADRRMATRLLYNYFRLGLANNEQPVEQRLFISEFICSREDNLFLNYFHPKLNHLVELPVSDKLAWLEKHVDFKANDIFPFARHLSAGIDQQVFLESLLVQPDLYIRMHRGKDALVKSTLQWAQIPFTEIDEQALALPNGTKLDRLFAEKSKRPYEVQDISSQRTAQLFKPNKYDKWWDACAASGGKSLLLHSMEPEIKLLVSDIRESVLENLDERFRNSGLLRYQKKVLDLTQNIDQDLHHYEFDGIILDAPCTGSGTWGRTPEMISQFQETKISGFNNLQKTIASNVIKYLKAGKPLIYITCSVFREENEDVVNYLKDEAGLKIESSGIIPGYKNKADTLFAARLIR